MTPYQRDAECMLQDYMFYDPINFNEEKQIESDFNIDYFLNLDEQKKDSNTDLAIKKKPKPKLSNTYRKNFCRNFIRRAIKSMNCGAQLIFLQQQLNEDDLKLFIEYFQSSLDQITGFRELKKHIIVLDPDSNRKLIFARYLHWFTKQRGTLTILRGESQNTREYLRYKNEVLMYYVERPDLWISNEAAWIKKK